MSGVEAKSMENKRIYKQDFCLLLFGAAWKLLSFKALETDPVGDT